MRIEKALLVILKLYLKKKCRNEENAMMRGFVFTISGLKRNALT